MQKLLFLTFLQILFLKEANSIQLPSCPSVQEAVNAFKIAKSRLVTINGYQYVLTGSLPPQSVSLFLQSTNPIRVAQTEYNCAYLYSKWSQNWLAFSLTYTTSPPQA